MKNIIQDVRLFISTHSLNEKKEEDHIKSEGNFFLHSTKKASFFFRLQEWQYYLTKPDDYWMPIDTMVVVLLTYTICWDYDL